MCDHNTSSTQLRNSARTVPFCQIMPWKGGSPGPAGFCHPVVQSSKTNAQLYAATLESLITGYAPSNGCAGRANHSVKINGFGGVKLLACVRLRSLLVSITTAIAIIVTHVGSSSRGSRGSRRGENNTTKQIINQMRKKEKTNKVQPQEQK